MNRLRWLGRMMKSLVAQRWHRWKYRHIWRWASLTGVGRHHANGCSMGMRAGGRCVPGCETDAQLRKRTRDAVEFNR